MTIILDGTGLTIEKLERIARHGDKVEIAGEAIERMKTCRAMLEKKIKAHEIMYGVNTGIGEFSEVVLNDDQVKDFQRYLIYNHAAGIGDPAPLEYVRAAMAGRINVLSKGRSGNRPEIALTYAEMLNKGVVPFVCQKGSVGASGDLAPMSQIALLLLGEGQAYYKGELLEGAEAMKRAGIPVPGLEARDGLAAINGSNLLTAMSGLMLYDTNRWLKQAEIAAGMTLEALIANMKPYTPLLHEARGFPGAVRSAKAILKLVEGGDVVEGKAKTKVQDAYSMRSTPQVIGAAHDAVAWARSQVEIELNGVGDNPIFFAEKNLTISGANFQGTPVSLPMDMISAAVTMVSVLSERRMNRLNNPALSVGLPAFLTKGAGMFSGLMLSQYTADMQIVEQRILSYAGVGPVDPGRRGPGRLRLDGNEHRDQELPDPRQRLRRARDRVHGGGAGARFQGVQARPRHREGEGSHPPLRQVPRHRPSPLSGSHAHERDREIVRDPRRGGESGRGSRLSHPASFDAIVAANLP